MSVALPHGMHGLESLDPHLDTEESKGVKGEYGEYVRSVLRFVEGEDAVVGGCVREEEVERAVEWLLILRYNQHAISCDLTGDMLGNMISPAGSLFNHACDANIGLIMGARGAIRFTALTDIPAQTPLCISYLPEHTPYAIRRETLRCNWRFLCACARCEQVQAWRTANAQYLTPPPSRSLPLAGSALSETAEAP